MGGEVGARCGLEVLVVTVAEVVKVVMVVMPRQYSLVGVPGIGDPHAGESALS